VLVQQLPKLNSPDHHIKYRAPLYGLKDEIYRRICPLPYAATFTLRARNTQKPLFLL